MKRLIILLSLSALACGMRTLPAKIDAAPLVQNTPIPSPTADMPHTLENCANPEGLTVYDSPNGILDGRVIAHGNTFEGAYYDNDWIWLVDGGFVRAEYVCEFTGRREARVCLTADTVYLRANAGTGNAPVMVLTSGQFLMVGQSAMSEDGGIWTETWTDDNYGWMNARYVCEAR